MKQYWHFESTSKVATRWPLVNGSPKEEWVWSFYGVLHRHLAKRRCVCVCVCVCVLLSGLERIIELIWSSE